VPGSPRSVRQPGLLGGASIGALYTLQGIYTNELVGQENLGLLMGAQQAVFAVGGALGPVIAGAIVQAGNSYTPVVLLTASGFLTSALVLGPRPTKRGRAPSTSATKRLTIEN
jgi:MFS family permease